MGNTDDGGKTHEGGEKRVAVKPTEDEEEADVDICMRQHKNLRTTS